MQHCRNVMLFAALSAVTTMLLYSLSDSFAQESGLLPLGMNTFYDNNEFLPGLHIVGEVLNNTTETARFVEVSATLYDASNKVVGVGHTYTNPSDIKPGKKAPFEIIVYRDNVKGGNLNIVRNVSIQVS